MRAILLGAAVLAFSSLAANADQWRGVEGSCNDMRTSWTLNKDGDKYAGSVELRQVVALPCSPQPNPVPKSMDATATITGNNFTAERASADGTCKYSGTITGDQIKGTYTCGTGAPQNFTLTK